MGEQARPVSWRRTSYLVEAHRRAERHVNAGGHAVVDTSLLTRRAVRDAARRLGPLGALLVGVMPPLHISERWEAARSDRPPGHARRHYALVHSLVSYDLVLDTSTLTAGQAAELVLRTDAEQAGRRVLGSMG
jgi:chloramphenicol 3-O phosphotransferase